VDDEKQFLINTAIVLNQRGFEVTGVNNGFEALEEIRKTQYDVAVIDVNMPGMDGNQALRELRKIRPDLEVIMLTGYGTMASAFNCLREGAFDYLTKPCDIDMLANLLRDAYEKKKTPSI
jgi:DNA-binding NtrC family response regulator